MTGSKFENQRLSPEMARRAAARLGAVQTLFYLHAEHGERSSGRALHEYMEHLREATASEFDLPEAALDPDPALLEELVTEAWEMREELDALLDECLTNRAWSAERMDPVLRAIFRAALYELTIARGTAAQVVISEYLHIAACFFEPNEIGFVNGALDAAAKKAGTPLTGNG